jgi:2-C-methyl-D-erythritol 4-phosphate cytidylyltransferase
VWCLLLAAGSGTRFGAAKQFASLGGRTLVERAVAVAAAACDAVVLVLPETTVWDGPPVEAVVAGGATRAASVRAGLAALPVDAGLDVVVVHDAAHPLASPTLYGAVIAAVREGAAAACPALPVAESLLRRAGDVAVGAVAKEGLVLCQTPHAFRAAVLRALHEGQPEGSDEVSMLLARGSEVALVPGDPANLHVTAPADLALAERLLAPG